MKNKIVLYANTAFTIYNFRSELINLLKKKNFSIYVLCPKVCYLSNKSEQQLTNIFKKLDVNFIPLNHKRNNWNIFFDIFHLFNLFYILRKINPDIILNFTIKCTLYGSVVAFIAGVKNIFSNITGLGSILTLDSKRFFLIKFILLKFYKISLKLNKSIFFQNIDDQNFFLLNKIISKDKCVLINGSGVNLNRFKPSNKKIFFDFIFVGRLLHDKGLLFFIDACNDLFITYPNLKIAIVGGYDSNPNSISPELFKKKIKSKNFYHYNFTDDIRIYLSKSKVFVLPSKREGTPKAALEAMSMKLPIITTNVPGCREVVKHLFNGYLVEYGSVDSLIKAMTFFIKNEIKIPEMGNNSRIIAKDKYDINMVNNIILNTLLYE